MPTNETEALVRSIVEGLSAPNINLQYGGTATESAAPSAGAAVAPVNAGTIALQVVERVSRGADSERSAATPSGSDAGRLAAEVEQLRRAVTQSTTTAQQADKSTSAAGESDNGSSMAQTVLKTIGMVTGIGPIATGLMSLFGSSGSSEASFPTLPFEPPPPIAMEAGLAADRQFTGVTYGADGTPRSTASNAGRGSGAVPPIQINVQAMDSRSFLDHSDDIARAVREAMLHSHALNDVVSEL